MRNFRLAIVAAFTSLILLSGCAQNQNEAQPSDTTAETRQATLLSPQQTVLNMLDALMDQRLGEYYQYVSTRDKNIKSLDSLQAEFSGTDLVTEFMFANTRYGIDSTVVEGDSARVYIAAASPPVQFVMQNAFVVERDLAGSDFSTKLSILSERHKLAGSPREENNTTYWLARESNGWRVNVGWADLEDWFQAKVDAEMAAEAEAAGAALSDEKEDTGQD